MSAKFGIKLVARNPLNATIVLQDLRLAFDSTSTVELVESDTISETVLAPLEEHEIFVAARAMREGTCSLISATYRLKGLMRCKESLVKQGRRLHTTKAQLQQPAYDDDSSLSITISPSRPLLSVGGHGLPRELYAGEVCSATLSLRNSGTQPMGNLRVLCSRPNFVTIRDFRELSSMHACCTSKMPK